MHSIPPPHPNLPANPPPALPTLATLTTHLQTHLPWPPHPREVPYNYHTPRPPLPPSTPIPKLLLSLTPTRTLYKTPQTTRSPTLIFLHRPWTLDRKALPQATTVLASHKGFDELLTVGWNLALAGKLGVGVGDGGEGLESGEGVMAGRAVCVRGYKGEAGRRVGLVGLLEGGRGVVAREVLERVRGEFGALEGVWGFGPLEGAWGFEGEGLGLGDDGREGGVPLPGTAFQDHGGGADDLVKVVAVMNAFRLEEVERVAAAARQLQTLATPSEVSSEVKCTEVLYLTGAVREPGLEAARAKGMRVICVGHRACEEWGIRYLAEVARREFPLLDVEVLLEEEEEEELRAKAVKVQGENAGDGRGSKRKVATSRGDGVAGAGI
ncbi:hypothetical protein MBLNU230_g6846t1 [Neophaeotheca triangularis]